MQTFLNEIFFGRFDADASPETRTYFDCFCVVANGIGVSPFVYARPLELDMCGVVYTQSDPSGNKLKELIMEKGITNSVVDYLKTKVPAKLYVNQFSRAFNATLYDHFCVVDMIHGLCVCSSMLGF